MKKIGYIFCLLACMFFNIYFIEADESNNVSMDPYECPYTVKVDKGKGEYYFTITFDPINKTFSVSDLTWKGSNMARRGSIRWLDDYLIEYDPTLENSREDLRKELEDAIYSGTCDTTLLVFWYWSNGAQHEYLEILFNDTLEANARNYMKTNITGGTYKDLTSAWATLGETSTPGESHNYNCKQYDRLYEKITESADSIKKCDSNCASEYKKYEDAKQKLKSYCSIQFKYLDYGHSCLGKCLETEESIKQLGIEDSNKGGTCGISQKLAIYIRNIVKWLKYIIPVIVIVLGILDFIKAISADKDDEMKKAQGKFVKRLIAAALIFIIPFIIEFVLDKMGFEEYVSGCGIIDL